MVFSSVLVGVLPDLLVGVVELNQQDDGDRLEAAVAVLVLRLLRHAVEEVVLVKGIVINESMRLERHRVVFFTWKSLFTMTRTQS